MFDCRALAIGYTFRITLGGLNRALEDELATPSGSNAGDRSSDVAERGLPWNPSLDLLLSGVKRLL